MCPSLPDTTGSAVPVSATPRVALVTGAGQGIGAAIVKRLHAQGLRVALLDKNGDCAAALAGELDPRGETALSFHADVSDVGAVRNVVRDITATWNAPDVLVNNAAATAAGSVWDIGLEEWDAVLATNLRSVFALTRLCAGEMRRRHWGRVINLASLAGQQGGALAGAHYSASKAGVLVLTKVFASELAAHGVTVNAVAPAAVLTPAAQVLDPEALARTVGTIPVGRAGLPSEVGGLVAYLASEEAGYVTGATFDINGGIHMR